MILLFRPFDCPIALQAIDDLNALHAMGRGSVIGYLVAESDEVRNLETFAMAQGIKFPLQRVGALDATSFLAEYNLTSTPLVVRATARSTSRVLASQLDSLIRDRRRRAEHASRP